MGDTKSATDLRNLESPPIRSISRFCCCFKSKILRGLRRSSSRKCNAKASLDGFISNVGDYEHAARILSEAVNSASQQSGKMHADYGYAAIQLARTYEAMGRSEDASELYAELSPLIRYFCQCRGHASDRLLGACSRDSRVLPVMIRHRSTKLRGIVNEGICRRSISIVGRGEEPSFHLLRAIVHHRRGQLEPAIDELKVGLEKAQEPQATIRTSYKHLPSSRWELEATLADYLVEAGRTEEAKEHLRNAVAHAR